MATVLSIRRIWHKITFPGGLRIWIIWISITDLDTGNQLNNKIAKLSLFITLSLQSTIRQPYPNFVVRTSCCVPNCFLSRHNVNETGIYHYIEGTSSEIFKINWKTNPFLIEVQFSLPKWRLHTYDTHLEMWFRYHHISTFRLSAAAIDTVVLSLTHIISTLISECVVIRRARPAITYCIENMQGVFVRQCRYAAYVCC